MATKTSLIFEENAADNVFAEEYISKALKRAYQKELLVNSSDGGKPELNTGDIKNYFAISTFGSFVGFRPNNPHCLMNRVLGYVQREIKNLPEDVIVVAKLCRSGKPYFDIEITKDAVNCVNEYEARFNGSANIMNDGIDFVCVPLEEKVRVRVDDEPLYSQEGLYNVFRQGILQGIVEVEEDEKEAYIKIGPHVFRVENGRDQDLPMVLGEFFLSAVEGADYMQLEEMADSADILVEMTVLGNNSTRSLEELIVDIENRMMEMEENGCAMEYE